MRRFWSRGEAPTKKKQGAMDAPPFVWVSLVLSLLTE